MQVTLTFIFKYNNNEKNNSIFLLFCSPFVPLLLHRFASAGRGQSIGDLYPTVSGNLQQGRPRHAPNFLHRRCYPHGQDGTSITGAEQIGAFWATQFKGADVTLGLTQTLVSWSDANHAYLAKGTYRVTGATVQGDTIDFSGAYTNIMLQQNGVWKIAKSVSGE